MLISICNCKQIKGRYETLKQVAEGLKAANAQLVAEKYTLEQAIAHHIQETAEATLGATGLKDQAAGARHSLLQLKSQLKVALLQVSAESTARLASDQAKMEAARDLQTLQLKHTALEGIGTTIARSLPSTSTSTSTSIYIRYHMHVQHVQL